MDGTVHLTLEGEDLHIERDIEEQKVPKILEAFYEDDTTEEIEANMDQESQSMNGFELTDDVMNRLSRGQEAFIQTLIDYGDNNGWVTSEDVVPGMAEYGRPIDRPGNIGGVRKGMTQKFGDDNDIIEKDQRSGDTVYRLNPAYRDEFRDHFNMG
ncbi:hypothetical protein [Halococcus sp. PRR34]|uniref:hypothetical protein n=1 Tax=Halococcus sp. PRR34 TaxID=3020830 RepID=UPI00235DFF6B|nr:hypothetical protein [Halococcus sp. PRR34]